MKRYLVCSFVFVMALFLHTLAWSQSAGSKKNKKSLGPRQAGKILQMEQKAQDGKVLRRFRVKYVKVASRIKRVMDGRCTSWYSTGQMLDEKTYVNDNVHGLWIAWYPNGQKHFERNYSHGKMHGPYRSWYQNGKLKESGTYTNGKRDGTWTIYLPSGKKARVMTFPLRRLSR